MRDADKLIFHPNLGHLLRLWGRYEGPDAPKAWLKQQAADDWRLGTILTGFFGRSISDGKVRHFISRKSLEPWFTLDADFQARLQAVDRAGLNRWQSHAVGEALRIIEHKSKGISEVEFPD
jgi:hypothetical protein